jgi:hypothetical protein
MQPSGCCEGSNGALNTHRHLHSDGNTLYISELFEWYEDDYAKEEGSVREFIKAMLMTTLKKRWTLQPVLTILITTGP